MKFQISDKEKWLMVKKKKKNSKTSQEIIEVFHTSRAD